ncbi:uncharacterized protein Z519_05226 [Cladophialophora bantiana CBS 173.52]|uniref:Zn(2)-C6 fungal-type domain-containing protein n=1 Tax=Cladophialophora bantiana (strain ATCC 10958 / CBS 173.52 / CDC B-1940 / NIH 8579) TaxID=1442370 RepID=A0A0D2EVQ8_CLAB1|nr:uncharacterized protein Z519_05226 [Cladophialophora bantiana CBS 173.52]KIW93911.1 hypothetical protein Z519_05226 [Cladophialophora bantiana CBS 173.52]
MPTEVEQKPKSKHRKSTCAGCRRRKSKCDGKTPKCTTCIAYKDDCHYDKPPSLAYVRSLEEEIQELKAQLRQAKTQVWLSRAGSHDDKKLPSASPASETAGSQSSGQALAHRNRHIKWEADISVDDSGGVTFHNSTSPIHEPPSSQRHHPPIAAQLSYSGNLHEDQRVKRDLILNATHQRQIEPFAIANGAAKTNVPKEISHELLKYHWCWMHPLFLFVYRPAFTRGMAMVDLNTPGAQDPPYFSETLLKVIHAHGSRFLNHDVYQDQYHSVLSQHSPMGSSMSAGEFMQKITDEARFGLGMDILRNSSIPTIQALLQQSAREVVLGRSSQAWTFSGVAFRMALDMGIHLPSDKLQAFVKSLTPEDIEIRKRLFWSCYTWDKILSLYLGRMPGFTPATEEVPLTFMDDYSDGDLWAPYYGETPTPELASAPNYPPCPGYVVSCFRQLCKICVILNDLMHNIYSSEAAARREMEEEDHSAEAKAVSEAPFVRISRDLRDWLISLPPHLRINPDQMPSLAPPVHIMSLNLLYHTTVILLHRPVVLGARDMSAPGPARSWQMCIQATGAIHDLIMLQANTFGLTHVSYLNAYSVYIAATIAVLRFEREYQPGDDPAAAAQKNGLSFLLEVLQKTSSTMPVLERSNAIIRKRMKAALDRQKAQQGQVRRTYSNGSTPPNAKFSIPTPTSHQMDLAQPTAFQALSNPALVHGAYSQPDTPGSFVAPMQWQSGMRSSLYSEPAHGSEDFLPAFPGQQFPVGSEHSFGSNEVDPHARTALLGYNLDPHPRLSTGDIDWNFMDTFEGQSVHM